MLNRRYYIFSGRTFSNREILKRDGATWNPDAKVWMVSGRLLDRTVWEYRRAGVKVEIFETAPAVWCAFYGEDDDAEEVEIPAGGMIDITNMSDDALDALLGM